jgi:hypothetical protein
MYFVGEGTLEVRLHEEHTGYASAKVDYTDSPNKSRWRKGSGGDEGDALTAAECPNGSSTNGTSAGTRAAVGGCGKGQVARGQAGTGEVGKSGKTDTWTFEDELESKPYRYPMLSRRAQQLCKGLTLLIGHSLTKEEWAPAQHNIPCWFLLNKTMPACD